MIYLCVVFGILCAVAFVSFGPVPPCQFKWILQCAHVLFSFLIALEQYVVLVLCVISPTSAV